MVGLKKNLVRGLRDHCGHMHRRNFSEGTYETTSEEKGQSLKANVFQKISISDTLSLNRWTS